MQDVPNLSMPHRSPRTVPFHLVTVLVAALLTGAFAATAAPASAQELTQPDWMEVNHDQERVTMEIVAGLTDELNGWNYNGYIRGSAEIVVPEGYEIEIEFTNQDLQNPHSLGIGQVMESYPANLPGEPVFEGAITSGATAKMRATQSGQSETISFVADTAGEYAMICYIPLHAIQGMWIYFTVSAEGESGVVEGEPVSAF